jgi:hypothetical protein
MNEPMVREGLDEHSGQDDFKVAVHKLRQRAKAKATPGSKRDRSGAAASSGAAPRVRYPVSFPGGGTIIAEFGQSLMAPGVRLHKDMFNARWQATHCLWGSFSRSFNLYGESKALMLVAQWSWRCHLEHTGQACPMEWLLKEDAWKFSE